MLLGNSVDGFVVERTLRCVEIAHAIQFMSTTQMLNL